MFKKLLKTKTEPIAFDDYLDDIPKLHTWDNGKTWVTGGFKKEHLRLLHDTIQAHFNGAPVSVLETGAGNSTLTFLLLKAAKVLSICPDPHLLQRIKDYCDEHHINRSQLDYRVDFSEWELPGIAGRVRKGADRFDVAFMDGGHGWPTVFVDFCYMNFALKKGGLLVTDDIQLHSVKELCRLLEEQPGFRCVEKLNKIRIWVKEDAPDLLPDHGAEPYITRMSETYREAGSLWDL